jgi:IS30 family transposase
LTWDQGKEMSQHPQFTITTLRPCVYFCDPHSPWQRGSNKNTNGSLRQYFPKGSDMTASSQRPHRGGHRARRTAIENPELGPPSAAPQHAA